MQFRQVPKWFLIGCCMRVIQGGIANQGIRNLIKDAKDHQIESALEQGKSEGMKTFNMSIGELLGHHKISKDTADMHTGTLSK